jgi:hypothetical protein
VTSKFRAALLVAVIEERFIAPTTRDGAEYLSAHADAFTGSEREEKASACFARNDTRTLCAEKKRRQDAGATESCLKVTPGGAKP